MYTVNYTLCKEKTVMEKRIAPKDDALEKLENYILTNHLPANSKIPSERYLCELWGMNRTTLRQAIKILVGCGRLYSKKGKGTLIAEPKITRDIRGVNALSTYLRNEFSFTTKILSFRTIESNKQISKNLHVPLGHKAYEIIRLRNISGQPCVLETMYLNGSLCPDFDKYYNETNSMYSIFKNIYHKELARGEESISITYASEEEAELLDIETGSPVFFTKGNTQMEDGTPFEYYKALFRADRFRFVSNVKWDK